MKKWAVYEKVECGWTVAGSFDTKRAAKEFIARCYPHTECKIVNEREEQKKQKERFNKYLEEVRQRVQQNGGIHVV